MPWTKQTKPSDTWSTLYNSSESGFLQGAGFLNPNDGYGFLGVEPSWSTQSKTADTWTKVT